MNVDDEGIDIDVSNELQNVTAGCDGSISNKGCIVVKVHFGELDTIIKQERKELGSMKRIQGRVQISDRCEIECQLIHSHDMLIDAREKILLPIKYHRETADVNLSWKQKFWCLQHQNLYLVLFAQTCIG